MSNRILGNDLKFILEAQESITKRTNIPNDHPILAKEVARLRGIAEGLGIDFEATQYTFTVDLNKEGSRVVYSPYVGLYREVPTLCWGLVRKPLSELKVSPAVAELDRRVVFEFVIGAGEDAEFLAVSAVLAEDQKTGKPYDLETVKKAAARGKLAEVLGKTFVKPASLSELPVGDYLVQSYEYDAKFDRYSLEVASTDGKLIGVFKANNAIASYLVDEPAVTPEKPADLSVMQSTKEVNGFPVVPVRFVPAHLKEVPVFSF